MSCTFATTIAVASLALGGNVACIANARNQPSADGVAPHGAAATGCSAAERREVLRAMQAEVLRAAPGELPSFATAVAPGG